MTDKILSKLFAYHINLDGEISVVSGEDIIKDYWNEWTRRMIKKFGVDTTLINYENCIADWVVINWAWEINAKS